MILGGITQPDVFAQTKTICCEMGHLFQVQDDFLDCYGDPAVIGKIGTDIQDNKCGWLVVQALKRASPEQKKILEDNYAQHDDAKVAKVKAVYKELNLEQIYKDYEEESYARLQTLIKEKAGDLPEGIFTDFAKKIYKRIL